MRTLSKTEKESAASAARWDAIAEIQSTLRSHGINAELYRAESEAILELITQAIDRSA